MSEHPSSIRTRWAAIGAAVAVTLGAAGIGSYNLVNADVSSGDRPVYIPINPCRLLDTRAGVNNVGPRSTPMSPDETIAVTAHGANGECTGVSAIPSDATALAMNVTALNATSQTFLTFWGDGPNPGTANLNPAPGQPPTPNAVNTPLSGAGTFNLYNERGNVNVVIDVNGYYAPHDHDDRYEPIPDQVVLAPADFLPWTETTDYRVTDVLTLQTGSECFTAPVHLPDGSTIESATAIVSVTNANDSVTAYLGRTLIAEGTSLVDSQIGWIASSTQQITQNDVLTYVTDDTIADSIDNGDDALVDNSTYTYYARVCLTAGHTIAGYIVDIT